MNTSKPKLLTVRQWSARCYRLKIHRGPVRGRIQPARISGTTWPLEAIAVSPNPRVIHNAKR